MLTANGWVIVDNTACAISEVDHRKGKFSQTLFTKHLRQAGCRTALFGKLHVSGRLWEADQRHPNDGQGHAHAQAPAHAALGRRADH